MILWETVKYFEPSEFNEPDKLVPLLVYALDTLREFAGRPIIVNSSYREGDDGTHGRGEAADIVITGHNVLDQFLLAERTRLFAGIGVYPYWNRPGLHLDVRRLKPHQHGARWGRNAAGDYVPLNAKFLRLAA